MKPLILRIPASTSNLGPGFDVLGLALSLYLKIHAQPDPRRIEISTDQKYPPWIDKSLKYMLRQAAAAFFKKNRARNSGVILNIKNNIPLARGLGSSAAIRLGILTALNRIHDASLDDDSIVQIGCRLEHHPENIMASFYGGLSASALIKDKYIVNRVKVSPRLRFVALIPEIPIETENARKVLPASIRREDAVFNMQRTALLFHTLAFKPDDLSPGMFDDRLHQPARSRLFKPLPAVIQAAINAGARGAFLSGSGSTILAVCLDGEPDKIGSAMQHVLNNKKITSTLMTLKPENHGIKFLNPE